MLEQVARRGSTCPIPGNCSQQMLVLPIIRFSADGESVVSMGNLFLCLTTLTIMKFFLVSNPIPSGCDFNSSVVFSSVTMEKSLFPTVFVAFNTLAECYH